MSVTVTQVKKFVEGGSQSRRFLVVGDASYPTGGYNILAAIAAISGLATIAIKRIISVRSNTVASQGLGAPVAVATYTGDFITGLKIALVQGAAEVANATDVSTMSVEVITEGY